MWTAKISLELGGGSNKKDFENSYIFNILQSCSINKSKKCSINEKKKKIQCYLLYNDECSVIKD